MARNQKQSGHIRIDGVDVIEEIGRGTFSTVYRARKNGRDYALKLVALDPRSAAETETQFVREAAHLGRLSSSHLVEIHEVGRSDQALFLIMEYINGPSLATLLGQKQLAEATIIDVAQGIAKALIEVHRHGLVHRDVKPANILFEAGDPALAKLIDFGFAIQASSRQSKDGAIAGTFNYCSPEQAGSLKRPIDGRSDLYALGVVLFECATGQLPYQSKDLTELLRMHAVETIPDPRRQRPDLSPELAGLIVKLLAKDPDDRYASAVHVVRELQRFARAKATPLSGEPALGVTDIPLVGRESEYSQLRRVFEETVSQRKGALVVVDGVAGLGKTRLLKELLAFAQLRPSLVLTGKCSMQDPTPLSALRQTIDSLVQSIAHLPADKREKAYQQVRATAKGSSAILRRFSASLGLLFNDTVDVPTAVTPDEFFDAVLDLFVRLSTHAVPLIIHIDDIQWLDAGSWQVIRRLAHEIDQCPILITGTARNDAESQARLEHFCRENQEKLKLRLSLAPLTDEGTEELIRYHLGGRPQNAAFSRMIVKLSQGNPFATGEYVRTVLEEGLLRPYWGQWLVDMKGVENLAIPSDVIQLVIKRIAHLSEATNKVLSIAAVMGNGFDLADLPAAAGGAAGGVLTAISDAVQANLIERDEAGGFNFVHDRVREAFLARLSPSQLQAIHQSIAQALAPLCAADPTPRKITDLARHYAAGDRDQHLPVVFESNKKAAMVSLENFSYQEAYIFFQVTYQAAKDLGCEVDEHVNTQMGEVCKHLGKLEEAESYYNKALAKAQDRHHRAHLFDQLSNLQSACARSKLARDEIIKAFAEMDSPIAKPNLPLYLVKAVVLVLAGVVLLKAGWLRRFISQETLAKHRTRIAIGFSAMWVFAATGQAFAYIAVCLMTMYSACLLGSQRSLAQLYSAFGILVGVFGLRRVADPILAKALALAEITGERDLLEGALSYQIYSYDFAGYPKEGIAFGTHAIMNFGSWTDQKLYLHNVEHLCNNAFLLGQYHDMLSWLDIAAKRAKASGFQPRLIEEHVNFVYRSVCETVFGHTHEAAVILTEYRAKLTNTPDDVYRWNYLIACEIFFHLEQQELGEPLDRCIADYEALPLNPLIELDLCIFKQLYVLKAYARLAQAMAASEPVARRRRMAQLRQAIFQLARVTHVSLARYPMQLCHLWVVKAGLALLNGRPRKALTALDKAGLIADEIDSVWAFYEVAKLRSRIWDTLGKQALAKREAGIALTIARTSGWVHRAQAMSAEFDFGKTMQASAPFATGRASSVRGVSPSPSKIVQSLNGFAHSLQDAAASSRTSLEAERFKNQHKSLLDVSLASATSLDPDQQAQRVLEELVRILGAERGFLFLVDPRDQQLKFKSGRDFEGTPLAELSGHSDTIIQKVKSTRQPVVVSGTDDDAALDSKSVIVHNLRSIIAAPLVIRERFLGVIYLDNRLARGVFGEEHLQIFAALANHIAIAMETARAAAVEVEKKTLERDLEAKRTVQTIIDHLQYGVFMCGEQLCIDAQYSQHLETIFAHQGQIAGAPVRDFLFDGSSLSADEINQASEALSSVFGAPLVAFEFNSHLLPSEFTRRGGEQILQMEWMPLLNASGIIHKVMATVRDVTESRRAEQAASADARELRMIGQILAIEPKRFTDVITNTNAELDKALLALATAAASDEAQRLEICSTIFRHLHTIKGIARIYHLTELTSPVHEAERFYADYLATPTTWDNETLTASLIALKALVADYQTLRETKLHQGGGSTSLDWQRVYDLAVAGDLKTLRRLAKCQLWPSLPELLAPIEQQVSELARQRGVIAFSLKWEGAVVRIDPQQASTLEAVFIHLMTNCVDHGLAGASSGTITIESHELATGGCRVIVHDTGRGLALATIREMGITRGLIEASASDELVADLIFRSGLSTARELSEVSGRGVGLDAVRRSIEELGGSIQLQFTADSISGFRPFAFVIAVPAASLDVQVETFT